MGIKVLSSSKIHVCNVCQVGDCFLRVHTGFNKQLFFQDFIKKFGQIINPGNESLCLHILLKLSSLDSLLWINILELKKKCLIWTKCWFFFLCFTNFWCSQCFISKGLSGQQRLNRIFESNYTKLYWHRVGPVHSKGP